MQRQKVVSCVRRERRNDTRTLTRCLTNSSCLRLGYHIARLVGKLHDRLVHIHPGAAADLPSETDPRPSVHHLQKRISARVTDAQSAQLLADLPTNRAKAQYISHCQDPYTYSALPTCPELTLDNKLLPISIARRLLSPVTPCTCEAHQCVTCTNPTDILGDHSLLCFHDGNPHRRTLWHDASYRVWGAMLKSVTGRLLSTN